MLEGGIGEHFRAGLFLLAFDPPWWVDHHHVEAEVWSDLQKL